MSRPGSADGNVLKLDATTKRGLNRSWYVLPAESHLCERCRGPLTPSLCFFLSLLAWLKSRQAVIKRGVTAREANRARVVRSYKP